jgi:[acyl-carrier-protein] S-malonyltransferase
VPHKVAFLFPGQGSQFIGMGQNLLKAFPEVKKIFEEADDICRKSISKLCFEGPLEELTLTVNLQPAITAVNLACLHAVNQEGIHANVSAGHSLGEYAALTSAGVISNYEALRLVQKRGELMHRESIANPGAMAAVIGLDIESLRQIVALAAEKGVLSIANHNTKEQIVITGEKEALSYALELIKKNGAKAIPLKVSGAWHCKLMIKAVDDFRQFMAKIPFSSPRGTILFNATANSENEPEKIKEIMAQQLVSPVKWYDIIKKMLDNGVDCFIEVGPKKVLTGLLQKIIPRDSEVKIANIEDSESLKLALALIN